MSVNSTQQTQVNSYNMRLGLGSTASSAVSSPLGNVPLSLDPTRLGNVLSSIGDVLAAVSPLLMAGMQRMPMLPTLPANTFGAYPFAQLPMPGLQRLPQSYVPAMGNPMIGNPMMGNPMMGNPLMGNPLMGNPALGLPMATPFAPAMNPTQANAFSALQQVLQMFSGSGAVPQGGLPPGGVYNGAGLPNANLPNAPQTNAYGSAPNVPTTAAPTGEVKFDAAGNVQMDKDRATREIARNFDQLTAGKDNFITKDDLKAIANGEMQRFQVSANYTPELRAAAKYLLDHPDDFKSLETADSKAQGFKGHADGKIGKGDTTAAMQQVSFSVGEKEALQTLAKYGNSFFTSGDKMVSKSDLDAIVKTGKMPDGTAAPQDMKDAAKLILSQPELFDKMDNAFKVRVKHRGDQRGDGLVSADDLREVLKGADTQPGPSGLKGEIFGNVRADSLAGLLLRGLNDNVPQPSQAFKDNVATTFQNVPTSVRLY